MCILFKERDWTSDCLAKVYEKDVMADGPLPENAIININRLEMDYLPQHS
jgi:hypothetical protein